MQARDNPDKEKLNVWMIFSLFLLVILFILLINMRTEIENYCQVMVSNCVNDWLNRTSYGLIPDMAEVGR